jgi:predicted dinucleotide-binding enzyme
MILGVIGAGQLGGSVARAYAASGNTVIISSRHPNRLDESTPGLSAATIDECARQADVLLLATPYRALPQVAQTLNPHVTGKIIIDATNPNPYDSDELSVMANRDGMGITTQRYLPTTKLVRAFSSVNAGNIIRSRHQRAPLAIPVAGNDPAAVAIVEEIVRDAGCTPVVTGDLASGRIFEWGHPGCLVHADEAGLRSVLTS